MYMRRKNCEHARVKRTAKRSKLYEALNSSQLQYIKLVIIWLFFMAIDFMMEFRFEYFWPCWLLFRSVHDSFKYQGLIFSLFFLCIALTSDVICYLFIPVTWLFFLGSTYVWVQLIWHTERGICLPTVGLCFIFMYVEFAVRVRDPRNLPFNIDLCRPFAAHCIGYPVVTLGFGFKSYISYKFRLRKQKDVQAANAFYFNLLDEALPEECRKQNNRLLDDSEDSSGKRKPILNGKLDTPQDELLEYCEQNHSPNSHTPGSNQLQSLDDEDSTSGRLSARIKATSLLRSSASTSSATCSKKVVNGTVCHGTSSPSTGVSLLAITGSSSSGSQSSCGVGGGVGSAVNLSSGQTSVCPLATVSNGGVPGSCATAEKVSRKGSRAVSTTKDELSARLETDIKRLKSELQSCRSCEAELRAQLSQVTQLERTARMELQQSRQDAESLQNRVANLVTRSQTDKIQMQSLEKRVSEERKARQTAEQGLTTERKARKEDQEAASRAAVVQSQAVRTECTEACKTRRRELEAEAKSLRRDVRTKEDRLRTCELELSEITHLRELAEKRDSLMAAGQQEIERLNLSLREENRIKQELFTAYHNSMKEINTLNSTLTQREHHIRQMSLQLEYFAQTMPIPDVLTSPFLLGSSHSLGGSHSPPGMPGAGFLAGPMGMTAPPPGLHTPPVSSPGPASSPPPSSSQGDTFTQN